MVISLSSILLWAAKLLRFSLTAKSFGENIIIPQKQRLAIDASLQL
jgi:hypothetical protein